MTSHTVVQPNTTGFVGREAGYPLRLELKHVHASVGDVGASDKPGSRRLRHFRRRKVSRRGVF